MNQVFGSMLESLEVTDEHRRYILDYLNTLLAKGYYRHVVLRPGRFWPVVLVDHNRDNQVANGCAVTVFGHVAQRRLVVDGSELTFIV